MSNKSEATWHPNNGPEVPHADLIARLDEADRLIYSGKGVGPAVAITLHRDLRAALGDAVPRAWAERAARNAMVLEARLLDKQDALDCVIDQVRAVVVDALTNADDSGVGWDAEVSASALHEILDTDPPVSLARHDAEVKAQALDEALDFLEDVDPDDMRDWLRARAAAIRAEAE